MKKIITWVILLAIGVPLFYGFKHIAHVKCVEAALDMHCKKSYQGYQQVKSVDVPWWNPINMDGYACSAKVMFSADATNGKNIAFTARKARITDVANDDWEVNFGFWGFFGDDYRIFDVKTK